MPDQQPPDPLSVFKRHCKYVARKNGSKLSAAIELESKRAGFKHYHELRKAHHIDNRLEEYLSEESLISQL